MADPDAQMWAINRFGIRLTLVIEMHATGAG